MFQFKIRPVNFLPEIHANSILQLQMAQMEIDSDTDAVTPKGTSQSRNRRKSYL